MLVILCMTLTHPMHTVHYQADTSFVYVGMRHGLLCATQLGQDPRRCGAAGV